MRTFLARSLAAFVCLAVGAALAQFGPPGLGRAPQMASQNMLKLFGENTAFTASVELRTGAGENSTTIPGRMSVNKENSRMDMDLGQIKSTQIPAEALEMMKGMGMDKTIIITLGDKKVTRMVYPGLKAYVETPAAGGSSTNAADAKVETTELGKETVDGHPCIKNKQVVTEPDGKTYEAVTWNATDLKKFPVRIEAAGKGDAAMTLTFKDIKLTAPDAKDFELPTGCTKYESMQTLMQEVMMKQLGGMGMPPGGAPPGGPGK